MKKASLFCVVCILYAGIGHAHLDTKMNRAILAATAEDKTRTDKQKLFENRCQTIVDRVGFEEGVTGAARKFSCDVIGVGITLYAGADLGKHSPEEVGQHFVDALAKEGLQSEVFIKHGHEYGSSMAFYINGETWLDESVDPLSAIKKVDTLIAEANLILLKRGRIQEWIAADSEKT